MHIPTPIQHLLHPRHARQAPRNRIGESGVLLRRAGLLREISEGLAALELGVFDDSYAGLGTQLQIRNWELGTGEREGRTGIGVAAEVARPGHECLALARARCHGVQADCADDRGVA